MFECQKALGAINFAQIRLAEDLKSVAASVGYTMSEFADPDIIMIDPRQEASLSMEHVKEAIGELMKAIGAIGKMAGFVYLKLCTMRRSQYIEAVDSSRVARDMVKFSKKLDLKKSIKLLYLR